MMQNLCPLNIILYLIHTSSKFECLIHIVNSESGFANVNIMFFHRVTESMTVLRTHMNENVKRESRIEFICEYNEMLS